PGAELTKKATTEQVTEQAAPIQHELDRSLDQLTDVQWRILAHADVPRSLSELMTHAGYRQRPHFVAAHLEPLLAGGVLRQTIPDKPRSPLQRYVLTETGIKLKVLREHYEPESPAERSNGH